MKWIRKIRKDYLVERVVVLITIRGKIPYIVRSRKMKRISRVRAIET